MDIAAAVDRHYEFLKTLQDRADAEFEERADAIYGELWGEAKAGNVAAKLVADYCDDPYQTLAEILIYAAGMSRKGSVNDEARQMIGAYAMAKLGAILSDAADDKAEDEA